MDQKLNALRERWRDPMLTALAVMLTLLLFVLAPLRAERIPGAQEVGFALVAVLTGAVLILTGRRYAIWVLVTAILLAGFAAIHRLVRPSILDVYFDAAAWLLLSLALILEVGRTVFGPGRVTYHRVMGAMLLYFAVGLAFAAIYAFIGAASDTAFKGFVVSDSASLADVLIYFSFGVLTGIGSGDITAVHPIARSVVLVEAMFGQLYPATLLARIVTLEIEDRRT
ncbi:Ion channel [Methyloligella halotolerans]|uniref:Ion channel n=1 Tax=Methyloligella halotolerans TaxID=1177755 RepID=A0A1E2RVR3_9HYPH|nr:ion channel [Methyloligella halotolerans]ODA66139.1 Ion channel [Methyloligella halotolerans]